MPDRHLAMRGLSTKMPIYAVHSKLLREATIGHSPPSDLGLTPDCADRTEAHTDGSAYFLKDGFPLASYAAMRGVDQLHCSQALPGFLQSAPRSELFALVKIAAVPAMRTIWSDCQYVVSGLAKMKAQRVERDDHASSVRTSWPRLCQRCPSLFPSSCPHHDLWRRLESITQGSPSADWPDVRKVNGTHNLDEVDASAPVFGMRRAGNLNADTWANRIQNARSTTPADFHKLIASRKAHTKVLTKALRFQADLGSAVSTAHDDATTWWRPLRTAWRK